MLHLLLHLTIIPGFFDNIDHVLIHIDGVIMDKLNTKCDPVEMELFNLLLSGYNQTEIAQKLDMSQSNISGKIRIRNFIVIM